MNIASLSRSLHGHVYSALQYSNKIGISKVLYTFYFEITVNKLLKKILFFVFRIPKHR